MLIPDAVDVEAPEYLAADLLVLLYMERDPRCSRCFRAALPVHGRYHRPADGSEEALVVLKSPQVLLCCCHSEILLTCFFLGRNPDLGIWICICLLETELSVDRTRGEDSGPDKDHVVFLFESCCCLTKGRLIITRLLLPLHPCTPSVGSWSVCHCPCRPWLVEGRSLGS